MDFKCSETLQYPLPLVWERMRDHLTDIATQQDDIAYARVEKRIKKKPNAVHVISTWQADPPLPSFIKGFIRPEMLIWTDDSRWDNDTYITYFHIATHYKVESITCLGTIRFEPQARGKNTKIIFSGILTIAKTSRSSIFLTGFVIRAIEAIAGKLIVSNFVKVIKAVGETLPAAKT